ncbi:hypothetical protein QFC24_000454 [Naganishia onofrii]|uniref:Uncharacterized protein n=1 Tax=Naganishia onofrii TaxID=1851511 RepID=A0ACC2XY98_9TREE|nr:hypothetical protein QFC24_000454 [Naganishia onofrii]
MVVSTECRLRRSLETSHTPSSPYTTASRTGKKTSASTAPKRKTVQPSRSSKSRAKVMREQSVDSDDELDEAEEVESVQEERDEAEEEDEEDGRVEQSQEAPEQVEPNFLETQQKDERVPMAELKARLEAKRMQKLRKTMNARVVQFNDIFAEAVEDLKKAKNEKVAKDLHKEKQVFEDFVMRSIEFQDASQSVNVEDVLDEFKATSREVGSIIRKFANKELAGFEDTLIGTYEIIATRPKRFTQATRDFHNHLTEELSVIASKTKNQRDAKKFMKAHFSALAKCSAA